VAEDISVAVWAVLMVVPRGTATSTEELRMPRFHLSVRGRLHTGAIAALLLVVGMLAAGFGAASAATPPQLVVTVSSVDSIVTDLDLAPDEALPGVLTAANDKDHPIAVTLSLSDDSDLSRNLVVDLTVVGGTGKFSQTSFKVPSKGPTATFNVTYSKAQDGVALYASVHKPTSTSPTPGQSAFFDVLESLTVTQKESLPANGLGADACGANFAGPLCGFVILPHSITSKAAALSSGSCSEANGCSSKLAEIQFIAGLDQSLYRAEPATLVLRCDKGTCKGKGVSNYTAKVTLLKTGDLYVSPPCPAKNTLPPLPTTVDPDRPEIGHVCTDYVSSHRDNAGDLLLEVLFDKDMRGTM
jgi:hypothetical protein